MAICLAKSITQLRHQLLGRKWLIGSYDRSFSARMACAFVCAYACMLSTQSVSGVRLERERNLNLFLVPLVILHSFPEKVGQIHTQDTRAIVSVCQIDCSPIFVTPLFFITNATGPTQLESLCGMAIEAERTEDLSYRKFRLQWVTQWIRHPILVKYRGIIFE